jgi:hypothetical protein
MPPKGSYSVTNAKMERPAKSSDEKIAGQASGDVPRTLVHRMQNKLKLPPNARNAVSLISDVFLCRFRHPSSLE